jgi:hypothetical protein
VVLTAATGAVQVDVRDGLTGAVVSGATVAAVVGVTLGSCSVGYLCTGLPLGVATVTVSMTGYATATATVTVVDGSTASVTVNLQPNVGTVNVTYKEGASGSEVVTGGRIFSLTASGFSPQTCTTISVAGATKGTCAIPNVPPGTYTLTDSTSSESTTITVQAGRSTTPLLTNTTPANTYVWSAA